MHRAAFLFSLLTTLSLSGLAHADTLVAASSFVGATNDMTTDGQKVTVSDGRLFDGISTATGPGTDAATFSRTGGPLHYLGLEFSAPVAVSSFTLVTALYGDGGVFGPGGLPTGSGRSTTPLESFLATPTIQVLAAGSSVWVSVSNQLDDYVQSLADETLNQQIGPSLFRLPANPAVFSFDAETNIVAIRVIGNAAGFVGSGGNGFVGAVELTAEGSAVVPEPGVLALAGLALLSLANFRCRV